MPISDQSTPVLPFLSPICRRPIEARFDGEMMSPNGSLLVLRQIEQRSRIARRLAACIPDRRASARIAHDEIIREGLGIEVDLSLPAERVIRSLNRIIEWHGTPRAIRVDNGPEYISTQLKEWAAQKSISPQHIQPGKPQQNAYIERYNRTVRHE